MQGPQQEGELGAVYSARDAAELAKVYDRWSEDYDQYMLDGGYRHPAICTALLTRHVPAGDAPVLDAGAGTGIMGELLGLLGYTRLVGLDFSSGMLKIARQKNLYTSLVEADLTADVPLDAGSFAAATAVGIFTTGHVGTDGFDNLLRLIRPEGHLVTTIKTSSWADSFETHLKALEAAGSIRINNITPAYNSIPGASTNLPSFALAIQKCGL